MRPFHWNAHLHFQAWHLEKCKSSASFAVAKSFFKSLHFMITIIIFFSSFFAVVQKTVKTILLKAFILYTTLPIYVTYLRPFILHCCLSFSGNTCDSDHYLKCTSVEKPLQLTLQTVFFNSYISRWFSIGTNNRVAKYVISTYSPIISTNVYTIIRYLNYLLKVSPYS